MDHDLANRYTHLALAVAADLTPTSTRRERMTVIADRIWELFGDGRPVSWVGFYFLGTDEMTLGPRRNKPACSPIGLHGACGTCARTGRTLIVRDVKDLGDSYIACDPRDRSEIVVPVRDAAGAVDAVLDLDSHAVGAFGELDRRALEKLVHEHLDGTA